MFRWKHTGSRVALRCAFALLGLIFLTVQLSGKFYACSSQVVSSKTVKTGIHSNDHHVLSLDKRYKAQKKFSLLIPFPGKVVFTIVPVAQTYSPARPASYPPGQRTIPSLRGPPVTF